ncbi:MAG: flagellar assembly protein FliW [Actinomycetes bacterium]
MTVTQAAPETLPAAPVPVLQFDRAMPGLPGLYRFALVAVEEDSPVRLLRCLDVAPPGPGAPPAGRAAGPVSLVVVPAAIATGGYVVELPDDEVAELGLQGSEDALVLLVITPGDTPAQATVNLMAPIVVNLRTLAAAQVLLDDVRLPVRARLLDLLNSS